uniref:PDZ domain-containing protein 8 n=1 Tax=Syphacia muris TaxID=451379 RepID=A0A0N5A8G6_9BILA
MISFFIGVLVGALLVLIGAGFYLFYPICNPKCPLLVSDQFPPIRIPAVLARFLNSSDENVGGSKWESCYTFSIIAHLLFQEFKDTRRFRRWVYKRLQIELNDLTTRSAAGLLIQDVRIRDLSIGSEFPVVSKARIESFKMSEDGHSFEELNLLFNLDYTGGFQTSIDVSLILNRRAQLSLKLVHLAGKVRLTLSRKPYSHWSFTFIKTPVIDFKSEWQGRQVKYVIPIITQQLRRILQRKHVYPNYKIRYRPFFPNPLFIPSPPFEAFAHIKVVGGLEVTVLQCTRLNISLALPDHTDIYCTISLDKRPFLSLSSCHSDHCFTVLINFVRHGPTDPLGMTFSKSVAELGLQAVKITSVESGSSAKKCGFQIGDVILAVNNVPIRSERQATKILCGTAGELNVLVERRLVDQIFGKFARKSNWSFELKDVLWGQSLHFALEEGHSRYLNVTVHSAAKLPSSKADGVTDGISNSKPCLLGYTSIYIPQIIADCQLTLSNCHREIFTLRPPPDPVPRRPSVEEASRHAGFDARLCYGDVLLSFRYFPSGLPPEANLGSEFLARFNSNVYDKASPVASPPLNDNFVLAEHNFEPFILKTACAICNGKVWLKSASRCSLCLIICHNKCVSKHAVEIPCVRNKPPNDEEFKCIVGVTIETTVGITFISYSTILLYLDAEVNRQSRRRRIAERVSEKFSSWGRMTHKNTPPSPTKYDLRSSFYFLFDKFSLMCEMRYQPGNAYNEEMISAAKNTGKNIFVNLEPSERRNMINKHISAIKAIIDKTTSERMKLLKNSDGSVTEGNPEFTALDNRLQALAVLMLHYCSALQVCNIVALKKVF